MSEKKGYDPVTAPVSGVDQQLRKQEMDALREVGDPVPQDQTPKVKEKTFWEKIGIAVIK